MLPRTIKRKYTQEKHFLLNIHYSTLLVQKNAVIILFKFSSSFPKRAASLTICKMCINYLAQVFILSVSVNAIYYNNMYVYVFEKCAPEFVHLAAYFIKPSRARSYFKKILTHTSGGGGGGSLMTRRNKCNTYTCVEIQYIYVYNIIIHI